LERSLFLARLLEPTFVAVALGMLLNPGLHETIIAEGCMPASCSICPDSCHCSLA
jgi:hypothetical protein